MTFHDKKERQSRESRARHSGVGSVRYSAARAGGDHRVRALRGVGIVSQPHGAAVSRLERSVQRVVLGVSLLFCAAWSLMSLATGWLGTMGSITAEILVRGFGIGAWAGVVVGIAAGVSVLRGRYGVLRAAGDTALVLVVSSLGSIAEDGVGGGLGDLFGLSAAATAGTLGATLVFALLGIVVIAERRPLSVLRGLVGLRTSAPSGASARPNGVSARPKVASVTQGDAEVDSDEAEGDGDEVDEGRRSTIPSPPPVLAAPAAPVLSAAPAVAASVGAVRRPSVIGRFKLPNASMLAAGPICEPIAESELREEAGVLEGVLASYDVVCKVENTIVGPTVVTYEAKIAAGTKMSKVVGLAGDITLAFGRKVRVTTGSRPGRLAFEIERGHRAPVGFRELLEDSTQSRASACLPVVLGRGVRGESVVADLAEMPHVIVAGATGCGKSVCLNAMLCSLLMSLGPDELRLVLIDPKVVELQAYGRVPHMLAPVVTDMGLAMSALRWAVEEMERRYAVLAAAGCKNLVALNKKSGPGERMPHVVIVVDEFADLVASQGKGVEALVSRLAQKARAAGIHLVLATQRPSVDVITGTIKANFPSRIALRVAQRVDSRTILDDQGAEHLAGRGDMLCKLGGSDAAVRVQCPMVSESDVEAVCGALAAQGMPVFDERVLMQGVQEKALAEVSQSASPKAGARKVWS